MSKGLEDFNFLPSAEAERRLHECFANWRWAKRIAAGRPYISDNAFIDAAGAAQDELTPAEWSAAIASHPRIGERGGHAPAASEREQRLAMHGSAETLAALADQNRNYETRFGHVFLIAAEGLTVEQILAELRQRIANDPATELAEVHKQAVAITSLRLNAMLGP